MAATMHAKINRKKLNKLNIIQIWLFLFLSCLLLFLLKLFINSIIYLCEVNGNFLCSVCLQWTDFESLCSNGTQALWNSNGYFLLFSLSFEFDFCLIVTVIEYVLLLYLLRWSCDCLRAKSETPLWWPPIPCLTHIWSSISSFNIWVNNVNCVFLCRWCNPFAGTCTNCYIENGIYSLFFLFPFPVSALNMFTDNFFVSKVEINEAWKVKSAPDPTVLPKGKSQAKFVIVSLLLSLNHRILA